jgi:benzoyl-CoA reductase/2-hydroxyglutaryl-CoA dehydratase subunit BcrC/BadD/HgdB
MAKTFENEYVEKAREEGKKVVGYGCLATPREIIEAAGLYPYRIKALGNLDKDLADAYLSKFNCGFCRSCLQLALDGTYDFLDGIVETNGCDHLRGMFENWQYAHPTDFFHYLRVPHENNADTLAWFSEELALLKEALSDHFEVAIEDSDLLAAMELEEDVAAKIKMIYESRWEDEIKISGSEVISLLVLKESLPTQQYLQILDGFIGEMDTREPLQCRARLFMGGSATDEIDLMAELESLGGLMIADSFCFGGRIFRDRAEVSGSAISQLASTYLDNLLCPRMFEEYQSRRSFAMEMIASSRADGAILFQNKFCDLHGIENVMLRTDLEKEGIPVLVLEKEYGTRADTGRLKTRVQAFLERMGK